MKIEDLKRFVSRKPIFAIRITEQNCVEISETIDAGDGCLLTDYDDPRKYVGDWYIMEDAGGQVMGHDAFMRAFRPV